MKNFRILLAIAVFAVLLSSCKSDAPYQENVTGDAGSVVVVMSKDLLKSTLNDTVKAVLMSPVIGLPQSEPNFNVIDIPYEAYTRIFETSRNLLFFKIDQTQAEPKITFQKDVNAKMQTVVTMSADNGQKLEALFLENKDAIASFYLKGERERTLQGFIKSPEKGIKKRINDSLRINIDIPVGYVVAKQTSDFVWCRFETPEISQGIIIYTLPYNTASIFTLDYLVAKRDSFLMNNVEGPTAGSFMTTEKNAVPVISLMKYRNNYSAELKGLWTVEKDFMGGPFVSIASLDMLENRVVVVEGYVYAPSKKKRNYVRQVETIAYSLKFNKQEEIDKIVNSTIR